MTFEKKKVLIEYYSDMWKYKNKHFWWLVPIHIFTGIFIILFPYISEILSIECLNIFTSRFYSIFGIIISAIFTYFMICEGDRMRKIGNQLKKLLPKEEKVLSFFKIPLSIAIPIFVFAVHLFLLHVYYK